jgi:hypothetical protein
MVAALTALLAAPGAHALGKKRHDVIPPADPDQPIAPPHGEFELRTLSYNVHGLPLPIFVDHDNYDDIGRYLRKLREEGRGPHVVAIQEAFHTKTWRVVTHSGYPYVAVGPQPSAGLTGSGLLVLSEYPVELVDKMVFDDCGGTDCLSRKGVVHARIRVPGLPSAIDYFNTHMNAGYKGTWPGKKAAEKIRQRQLDDVKPWYLNVRDPYLPGFFSGDFNFKAEPVPAPALNFPYFVSFSGMEDTGRACVELFGCAGDPSKIGAWETRIDHTFYASGAGDGAMRVTPVYYNLIFENASDGGALSDHPGVETHYQLRW